MVKAPAQDSARISARGTAIERWFFPSMACAMVVVAAAGFLPSLLHSEERRAPLTILAAAHGFVFFVWLAIFLVQARLIATRQTAAHRSVGMVACVAIALMLPLGYANCMSMARRGFDLSGDLKIDHDPLYEVIFPLGDLFMFTTLVVAALAYRHRPEIHKRLMLFANIALMPAPLAHFIGHVPRLAALPRPIILVPISIFLAAATARDFIVRKRVHPLTWALAATLFISGPLRAGLIGPSVTWHRFADWLAR